MSNTFLASIKADLQAGVIDVETAFGKVEAWVEQEFSGFGAEVMNILSADAKILVTDAKADLQQAVTNIQNSITGLDFNLFSVAFKAAVAELPIISKQGLQILETDYQMIVAYYASNNNITSVPANNGNLPGGNSGATPTS